MKMGETSDILICPVCRELFSNARCLPCVHTICLNCITHGGEEQVGKLSCPVCMEEFTIPSEGLSNLPRNFFIDKCLELRDVSVRGGFGVCEVGLCSTSTTPAMTNSDPPLNFAPVYCLDCDQNMCKQCSSIHGSMKMSKCHTMVQLVGTGSKNLEKYAKQVGMKCKQHPKQKIELFCVACDIAVCVECVKSSHQKHPCLDILQIGKEITALIQRDVKEIEELFVAASDELDNLAEISETLNYNVGKTKSAVLTRGEGIKKLVDAHVQWLLKDVEDEHAARVNSVQRLSRVIGIRKVALESFTRYATEVIKRAHPSYVVHVAGLFKQRVRKLKAQPQLDLGLQVQFSLKDSDLQRFTRDNIVGRLSFEYTPIENSKFADSEKEISFFPNESLPLYDTNKVGFRLNGTNFTSVAQYLLQQKALYCQMREVAEVVVQVNEPSQLIISEEDLMSTREWKKTRADLVRRAYTEQLKQNPDLKQKLFNTAGTDLAFASVEDLVMGIGLKGSDPRARDRKNWLGDNVLGEMISQVRDELLQQERTTATAEGGSTVDAPGLITTCAVYVLFGILMYLIYVLAL